MTTQKINDVINSAKSLFRRIRRFYYSNYTVNDALKIIEQIGRSRNPNFVIDNENRFAYENFIKWIHGDASMQAQSPKSPNNIISGDLRKGIFIAGNTGTGKSWCVEIMKAYAVGMRFAIQIGDQEPEAIAWRTVRADDICDKYSTEGDIGIFKSATMLAIQDFGAEPQEVMYMGNRVDIIRQLIECRGDRTDQLTLITSNLRISGEFLQKRYGERVASRLLGMCNYLEIKGKDRRAS